MDILTELFYFLIATWWAFLLFGLFLIIYADYANGKQEYNGKFIKHTYKQWVIGLEPTKIYIKTVKSWKDKQPFHFIFEIITLPLFCLPWILLWLGIFGFVCFVGFLIVKLFFT
ncbi:putative membrane protein [Campylobacter blaseri]|uniref:Uncharacterized protein n=1 Tax=Campylobacter blaseri TaxID=2042961 RepID=A0A2P8R2E4_9BACT|nr:hypothetical protein [Campylobacter blaseri]PSM52670.1 hypothetical protein CQ405_02760 [Campylobacter blaseri]PSM54318.1 hypothetical protein CRN67_02760 [Campylobacter blaseri]QKF85970.1 putative membrane protein [Campylobacter blaseri]